MTMDKRKKDKLAKKGWKTGSVAEFLDLSDEESAYIEMKLALSEKLKERRRLLNPANLGLQKWRPATRLFRLICSSSRCLRSVSQRKNWDERSPSRRATGLLDTARKLCQFGTGFVTKNDACPTKNGKSGVNRCRRCECSLKSEPMNGVALSRIYD
jgi:hypothetical protein